ncbi:MAG: cyclopropane-fatty-acyl-phospholipid synthase family protein [Burkholderiales bacterium]|nr:cyclopropane-fatty-acyl-phospholipid synthase family protein [Burkholderiales bacterium]
MNTTTAHPRLLATADRAPASARAVRALFAHMRHGHLTVHWPDGSVQQVGDANGLHATLVMHNWQPCVAAVRSGDIGFAESYLAGDWSSPDLATLLQVLAGNRQALDGIIFGHWAARLLHRARHWLNRNTKANSRKNIHAHYDLGNAFYSLWLDPSMNYSSAWFADPQPGDITPEAFTAAQHNKVKRVLHEAGVTPGSRVLEIGCGWGALAEMATTDFGAHLTGVTLSTEQLAWAQQRLTAVGCSQQTDLRLQDYRDIADGPYDAIASVEMVEAVGQAYWPTYFSAVSRLLKPGGKACIQSIVIQDHLFERYVKSTDFIQQYIFPGGCLPSPQAFRHQAQAQGLQVVNELAFGVDYADTCRIWRQRFLARKEQVLTLGFDERFIRIWEFYLAYCEAGFRTGDIDVMQFTLVKH